jgi:MYXO-CTERM domain-containing protein
MIRCGIVVATLAVAAIAGTAQANLLNNAGFESPLGFDFSNPFNWNGFFGAPAGTTLQAFNDTGAAPRSGTNALVTTIRNGTHPDGWNSFTGHVQIATGVVGGTEYEMSVWARSNPTINNGAEFRVEWQDAAGVEIARTNVEIQAGLTGEYQRFAFTSMAPAGATRAAVVLAVQSFLNNGSPADTSVAWDDASLVQVPAPGAAAMLGLGGIVAFRRRRR